MCDYCLARYFDCGASLAIKWHAVVGNLHWNTHGFDFGYYDDSSVSVENQVGVFGFVSFFNDLCFVLVVYSLDQNGMAMTPMPFFCGLLTARMADYG